MSEQLPLDIGLRDAFRLENFEVGANAFSLSALTARASGAVRRPLLLVGASGTGKTHLLHAACAYAHAVGRSSSYVSLRERGPLDPAVLRGLSTLGLVCVDDVDRIAGEPAWERAVFALYNECEAAGDCALLLTARASAVAAHYLLPDLTSRLNAAHGATLEPLDDAARARVLVRRAHERGMHLGEDVVQYVLARERRDMHTLMNVIDGLDKHSLARKRKITVALLREWLAIERAGARAENGE